MTEEAVPVDTGTGGEAPVAPSAPVTTENTRNVTGEAPTTNDFTTPDEYKDKGWAKNIKSNDDLWKNHSNAQELIGKKTVGVPDWDNATPQELSDYYSKTRPENAEAYEFAEGTTDEEKALYSKALYDNGVSKKQAEGIMKAHAENMEAQKVTLYSQEGLNKLLGESFKDNSEGQASAKDLMQKNMSDGDKAIVETMTNDQVSAMYNFANNINKTHGASEGQALNNEASSQNLSGDQVKTQQKAIRAEIAGLEGKPHNAQEKTDLINKLAKTYKGA